MRKLTYTPIVLMLTLLFLTASCVSKRKFLEADSARINALERIGQLNQEVAGLKGDVSDLKTEFNAMQNELRLSNARKDSYIDSLSKKAIGLSTAISKKDDSLNDQIMNFQSEKIQLNAALAQNQSIINSLTDKLKTAETQIARVNQESEKMKFDLANQKEMAESQKSALQSFEESKKKLQAENDAFKKEIASLKKQITTKNAEIEKLNNLVKLLKNQ